MIWPDLPLVYIVSRQLMVTKRSLCVRQLSFDIAVALFRLYGCDVACVGVAIHAVYTVRADLRRTLAG